MKSSKAGLAVAVAAVFTLGLGAAAADEIQIKARDCKRIVKHRPAAGVDYQPGVDVRGNPVAPADLGGGRQLVLPDVFTFDIEFDLDAYGTPEMKVGTVRYDINTGGLTFNGQPLTDADEHAIAEACARMQREVN